MRKLKIFWKIFYLSSLLFVGISFLLVLSLRWINPPGSAFTFAYNIHHDKNAQINWVSLKDISPWLQMSVIASEDQRFPNHWGFDIDSIKDSLEENKARPRGASTISQQTAKNLFLWNGRNYLRKGLEVWFTLLMELTWSKERILEVYLNVAEFGPGVYGAEMAAQNYFNISATKLNPWQSGLMAAVLPNPKRMLVAKPSPYVQSRAYEIYTWVNKLGGKKYLENL